MSERLEIATDVLIIGAGLSGVMAARTLQDAGVKRITLIDKGRSVGGRMATRRIGPGIADHGAQFFTARTDVFKQYVDQWIAEDLVYVWSNGFSDGSLIQPNYDGNPRYAVHGGMNALMQYLKDNLKNVELRLNVRIVSATGDEQGWVLQDEDGGLYTSKALIMTPPVPQALEILDSGATTLDDDDFNALARITYAECLTGLFWIDGRITLPQPGAVQRRNTNIVWIGDNQQKGISEAATIITVQAGEQYSRQMWRAPDDRILNALRTDLRIFMDETATIRESQLKRWRYSRPLVTHPERYMIAKLPVPLVFAGDAFGGPRVEGAFLSGIAAGKQMAQIIGVR
ncbi:MAG: NAD(P)/FAD-dependent oxidoreductase [Chloroflexota bacterium]